MKKVIAVLLVLVVCAGFAFAGEKARDGRFIAYDDGTVRDTQTGLMWAAKDNGRDINWANAKSYCENYRGGGYTDWRLPKLDEMTGLYDATIPQDNLGIRKPSLFDSFGSGVFWASDTRGSEAIIYGFGDSFRTWNPQSTATRRALPVRSDKGVRQSPQAAQTGDRLPPPSPPSDPVISSNMNTAGVKSGPTHTMRLTLKVPYRITYIQNYHYFNKGERPGTIALRHEDGTMYGPWQAEGTDLGGNVPNAFWVVRPNIEIKPGGYNIIDSSPSTWSYNEQSKNWGMTEIRGVKVTQTSQSGISNATPIPQPINKAISDISQQQLIEAVKTFRLEAIVEPVATIKKYSSVSTLKDFTGIENALFTETPPDVGWKYYFATATYTVSPLTEQTYIVLFYHPWSDTAIITLWQYGNKQFIMNHAELFLGDFIRQYGQIPFEVQPLWERKSATITPLLAIQLAVGETLVAFENIFPVRRKLENSSPFVKQRNSFDKNSENNEISKSMLAAANLRFERGITALIRYEQDKKLEVYRDATSVLLAGIKMGDFNDLKVTIPQTSQETFDLIKANQKGLGLFKVASILKTQNDCFVFLSHPVDPNNLLVFWFQTDNGKYGLRQANFINHIFSASYVSQIRELVAKVGQP